MSTQRGSSTRTRPQKHKNRTAFKNDLHDKTPKMKMLNSLHVCEVCQHCKGVIEWKIKYKKYKPLTRPSTCVKCQNRNVKKAYHVICKDCAIKDKVCAKCLKSSEEAEIIPPDPTEEEQLKMKVEMDQLLKSLPERKRRAFLRYVNKGKKKEKSADGDSENEDQKPGEEGDAKTERVPITREDLPGIIEKLKLKDYFDEDDDFSDSDLSGGSELDENSEEENESD